MDKTVLIDMTHERSYYNYFGLIWNWKPQRKQILYEIEKTAVWVAIACEISKTNTVVEVAFPTKAKLQITLCFFATAASYRFLKSFFRVSELDISRFIPEVLDAIYEKLKPCSWSYKQPIWNKELNRLRSGWSEKNANDRWTFPSFH